MPFVLSRFAGPRTDQITPASSSPPPLAIGATFGAAPSFGTVQKLPHRTAEASACQSAPPGASARSCARPRRHRGRESTRRTSSASHRARDVVGATFGAAPSSGYVRLPPSRGGSARQSFLPPSGERALDARSRSPVRRRRLPDAVADFGSVLSASAHSPRPVPEPRPTPRDRVGLINLIAAKEILSSAHGRLPRPPSLRLRLCRQYSFS